MIKVNLLQQNHTRSSSSVDATAQVDLEDSQFKKEIQKQFLLRILVVCLAPFGFYAYEKNIISSLESRERSLIPQLEELRAFNAKASQIKAEVDKFKEDETKIQTRIQALNSLSKQRLNEIKILDFFQQVIPEKVWLSEVEFKDGQVQVAGYAANNDEISRFQEVLTKSAFLKNVNLVNSRELVIEAVPLKQFSISSFMEQNQ
jgi:Tfp pilus assembly protein PilN